MDTLSSDIPLLSLNTWWITGSNMYWFQHFPACLWLLLVAKVHPRANNVRIGNPALFWSFDCLGEVRTVKPLFLFFFFSFSQHVYLFFVSRTSQNTSVNFSFESSARTVMNWMKVSSLIYFFSIANVQKYILRLYHIPHPIITWNLDFLFKVVHYEVENLRVTVCMNLYCICVCVVGTFNGSLW